MLISALVPTVIAAVLRRDQRALDAAGREVLRSAGHDPAALARQVFGGQLDPPWFRRLLTSEPAPGERVAAAAGGRAEPYRPVSWNRPATCSSRARRSTGVRRGHEVHSGRPGSR